MDSALGNSCVWAINEVILGNSSYFKTGIELRCDFNKLIEYAQKFVSVYSDGKDLVLSITPSRLNERLAVQRGKFLFPCNMSKSFESNLCSTFDFPFDTLETKYATVIKSQKMEEIVSDLNMCPSVIKINLSNKWCREAIRDLYTMNINSASLFPGLEGFAKSLSFITRKADYENII